MYSDSEKDISIHQKVFKLLFRLTRWTAVSEQSVGDVRFSFHRREAFGQIDADE